MCLQRIRTFGLFTVHEIFLPVQSSTWRFDVDTVASYTITVTCDDGKTGGTVTGTSVISLTPNLAPSITNMPGSLCSIFVSQNTIQFNVIVYLQQTMVFSLNSQGSLPICTVPQNCNLLSFLHISIITNRYAFFR